MLFIFSTPVLIQHLWQLKTVVFLHWCLIHAVLLRAVDICGSIKISTSTSSNYFQGNYKIHAVRKILFVIETKWYEISTRI